MRVDTDRGPQVPGDIEVAERRLTPREASGLDAWVLATAAEAVAYAASLLRDRAAAEDVVQDCYCRLIEKADFRTTMINMRTSGEGGMLRGRLPMILPTGEDCVRTAYATCGRPKPAAVRFIIRKPMSSKRLRTRWYDCSSSSSGNVLPWGSRAVSSNVMSLA